MICVDFLVPGADPRIYEEVKDVAVLQPLVEEYLGEYNADSKQPMHLVLFMDAIAHTARISRVVRQPKWRDISNTHGSWCRLERVRTVPFD